MTVSIITGVFGQDGRFLTEYLLSKGEKVIGVDRRRSTGLPIETSKASFLNNSNFKLEYADITDEARINHLVSWYRPDKYFNLAAMSHVGHSFKQPVSTFEINATAVVKVLEAIRNNSPDTKFYQASTSEIMGDTVCPKEGFTEDSPHKPRSPYGVAKLAAYNAVVNYREAYGLFALNGILFNHSSIYRGLDFATRKITHGVAKIVKGVESHIYMGNMEAIRDEGNAEDYVRAMDLMLNLEVPDDYIVSTGKTASIKEMLEYVCYLADLDYEDVYREDERFMRPSDVPFLKGNSDKIRAFGWEPKYDWKSTLEQMFKYDLEQL